jgi:hypothetical protein
LVKETFKCDMGTAEGGSMEEDGWMSEVVEPPIPRRKRRKFRKYPRPVCSAEQKKALWEYQERT